MNNLQQCYRSVAIIERVGHDFIILDCNQRFREVFQIRILESLSKLNIYEMVKPYLITVYRNRTDFKFPLSLQNKKFYGYLSLLSEDKAVLSFLEYNDYELILNQANISYFTYDNSGYKDEHNYFTNIHKDDYLKVMNEFSLCITGKTAQLDIEFRVEIEDKTIWLRALGEVVYRDTENNATKIIGVYQDITKYKQTEFFLANLAYRDGLTNTYNRLGLDNLIKAYIEENKNARYAIIFFDLDNFKKVNDIYGHKWGDLALVKLCNAINQHLPRFCHLSRVSGDEFILFVEHFYNNEDLATLTKKVLDLILHSNDKSTNDDAILTASAGIAIYPTHANTLEELVVNADMAMYISKKRGKAQFAFYSEEVRLSYLEATEMHRRLLTAFKNDEFTIFYQPIFNTESKQIAYYEAIPFWNHPTKGKLIDEKFVHILYQEGLIVRFDEWLIDKCLQDIVKLKNLGVDFKVSLNMSPKHLSYDYFTKYVESKLFQYDVAGESLKIEMVEFILKEDFAAINRNFEKLHHLNCEIIIDKFAINSSTIGVINEMHFDTIKINKFFVETIDKEYSSNIIFDTIFKIAKEHKKQFVAEGVMNQTQYEILVEKGCHYVQGNYVYEPKPLEDFFTLE